jgi:eukaryotic-like serine/threonine-protein kinase
MREHTSSKTPTAAKIVTLGEYRLVKKLGDGAMGYVYKAREPGSGRAVALKVLHRHMAKNPVFLERFYREARLMSRFNHPNFVHCSRLGKADRRYYLVMEYVPGRNLHYWLVRLGKLELRDAVGITLTCLRALEYAHGLGLVHRDIKPENVLIRRDGVVKIADFGLARLMTDDAFATETGHGAGTPAYMSPEQARDARSADHRSDLHALGCMLYQLVTGVLPFQGASNIDIVLAKLSGQFRPASELNAEVPKELDTILARLLTPALEDRYQSCLELLRDLTALGLASDRPTFLPEGGEDSTVVGLALTTPQDLPPHASRATMDQAVPDTAAHTDSRPEVRLVRRWVNWMTHRER